MQLEREYAAARSLACLQLRGNYANSFRRVLKVDFLPVVSPIPEELDAGEYGKLQILKIDAERLSEVQRQSLIDWIWEVGDTADRSIVESDVLANRASYIFDEADESEIVVHDPNAWG